MLPQSLHPLRTNWQKYSQISAIIIPTKHKRTDPYETNAHSADSPAVHRRIYRLHKRTLRTGCEYSATHTPNPTMAASSTVQPDNTDTPVTDAPYGILQDAADSYGFPLCLKNTEGMEKTEIRIYADHAARQWNSHSDSTRQDPLTWSLSGNRLVLSGQWSEELTVDIEIGSATSQKNGKEYTLLVYDEGGDVHRYAEYGLLQPAVNANGFPLSFVHTAGGVTTELRLWQEVALWKRTGTQTAEKDGLQWQIVGNWLNVYGDGFDEQFVFDREANTLTAQSDGTVYRLSADAE